MPRGVSTMNELPPREEQADDDETPDTIEDWEDAIAVLMTGNASHRLWNAAVTLVTEEISEYTEQSTDGLAEWVEDQEWTESTRVERVAARWDRLFKLRNDDDDDDDDE